MLKTMLIGQNRQHSLQPLIGELHYPAAPLTDQMFVVRLRRHGLVALESLTEVMGPNQAALNQKIQGTVDSGGAHPLSPLLQLSADCFDRQMFVCEEDDLSHEIALAGDRLMMFPKVTAEALGMGGGFCLIQTGHRP
jgi:hypothetical protein